MEVKVLKEENSIKVLIKGRIDSDTSPKLEKELKKHVSKSLEMILDFEQVDYISSAGLRAILAISKAFEHKKSSLTIINVSPVIAEVFDMTGFSEVINIK